MGYWGISPFNPLILLSEILDNEKWNYRTMPTCHPLFAMLMRELSAYIPQTRPTPYMLTIGTNMGSDSLLLLSAWILSNPEIANLFAVMEKGKGDVDFPGVYLGQRVEKRVHPKSGPYWRLGVSGSQTNLYGGLMQPELPATEDFIRMAGVLAMAYSKARAYFEDFRTAFYDTLREAGLSQHVVTRAGTSSLYATRNGRSFPELAETARGLPIDVSDYIWSGVQRGVAEIERAMYRPEDLALINKAYAGQMF